MYLQIKKAVMASFLSLFCFVAYAQQTVTGTVKDATGEPMIGVTVLADGKPVAVTDLDGNFTIPDAKPSTVVKLSYVGYKDQQVTVGNKSSLNFTMQEDNKALDEVVVVGYGTMKKSDLTGSIASVNSDDIVSKGSSNVLEAMQGSVPGVNITQSSGRSDNSMNIEIRGKSSINGSTTPLFIVDGVICDNIDFLNEQDIEKIDILKDASSTAIYGSRATAGVVMVTTKGGLGIKKGTKPSISYDGYYGVAVVSRMPDFQDAQQYYNWRFQQFLSVGGGTGKAVDGSPVYMMSASSLPMATMMDSEGNSVMKQRLASGQTYDWPNSVTQNGKQQNHYLAVSGSTDKVSYNMGLGYHGIEGVYKGDEDKKISFKASVDADVAKWLSAGFNFNMARIKHDYTSDDGVAGAYRLNPFVLPYDEEGNLVHFPGSAEALHTGNSNNFTGTSNPYLYFQTDAKQRETWRLLGNIYLDFKIIDGLDFKTTFSPSYTYYDQGEFDGIVDGDKDRTDNKAIYNTSRSFTWTWDNVLTYNKIFNKIHRLNLMGLYSMEGFTAHTSQETGINVLDGTNWWNIGTARGKYNETTKQYDATSAFNSSTGYGMYHMLSYAFRVNYTLMDRYMLTATMRWDGSSKLADGNRWVSFPSFALAWRLSEEKFIKEHAKWISNLKLRLSYGVTGNNKGIGNYDYMVTVAGPSYYPFGGVYGVNGMYPSGIVNDQLTWEKSHEWNVGLDFGFLRNRITGSVDWYSKKSKDLLYDVILPFEVGGSTMTTNIGSVKNTGIEASVTGVVIQNKNWNWTISANYAHNSNHVKDIDGTGNNQLSGTYSGNLFINGPVNNVYGYVWDGIVTDRNMKVPNNEAAVKNGFTPGATVKQSDYYYKVYGYTEGTPICKDLNGDGIIDADHDRKVFRGDPSWTGSISTSLSYSNAKWGTIDFSTTIYTKQHFNVYSKFYETYLVSASNRGRMRLNEDYYIPAGTLLDCDGVNADGTYINPKYQATTHYGDFPFQGENSNSAGNNPYFYGSNGAANFQDVSFTKVKNITLGYTFPKSWTQKWGCQRLRLYVNVTNPFVITGYKGFDPEWASASLKNDGPSTTTWQFGANIKF